MTEIQQRCYELLDRLGPATCSSIGERLWSVRRRSLACLPGRRRQARQAGKVLRSLRAIGRAQLVWSGLSRRMLWKIK